MRATLTLPWATELTLVISSEEQKATDGARILGDGLGIPCRELAALGENDRSATGFLPPVEFWKVVEEFFARPEESVRGWERAVDAQARVVSAIDRGLREAPAEASIAFVAHGCVGSLLLCHLKGIPIARSEEQPGPGPDAPPGSGGGCYFAFDSETRELLHGWKRIDAPSPVNTSLANGSKARR